MRASIFILVGVLASGSALAQTKEVPIDKGPNTPEANQAFEGGGVILQGAPGAPAPKPQALPPQPAPTAPTTVAPPQSN